MQNDFVIARLRELLKRSKAFDSEIVLDALETLERGDMALMLIDHLLKNGYTLFSMDDKIHLTNPLEESLYYSADSVEDLFIKMVLQSLTGES